MIPSLYLYEDGISTFFLVQKKRGKDKSPEIYRVIIELLGDDGYRYPVNYFFYKKLLSRVIRMYCRSKSISCASKIRCERIVAMSDSLLRKYNRDSDAEFIKVIKLN